MPYVNKIFTEEGFLDDLQNLLTTSGWTLKKRFKKVGYGFTSIFFTSSPGSTDQDLITFNVNVADHLIVSNKNGQLFGIARISKNTPIYKELPAEYKAGKIPDPTKLSTDAVLRESLHKWMLARYSTLTVDTTEIFFYMLKDMPTIPTDRTLVYPDDSVRAVLDVEHMDYTPIKMTTGSAGYYIEDANVELALMQSPMMKVKTREIGTASNGWLTNWWGDSKIRVQGLVSDETISLVIQTDNTAAYDDNNVPTIPIYMGQLVAEDPEDQNEAVLFGGSATSNAKFNYHADTPKFVTAPLLPLEKAYPKSPGNGIDNLIVKRAKYGAYYQAYYLSFQTAPEAMPPDRMSTDGKGYVSSWKNERNDEYLYKFNPSSYSKKTHVSRAYVIHPEEGVRGYLKDMIMTSSVGLINGDRLKLKKEACPDVFEIYKYFVVDAVSPMTKRPATPFAPAGFGIYEKEAN